MQIIGCGVLEVLPGSCLEGLIKMTERPGQTSYLHQELLFPV